MKTHGWITVKSALMKMKFGVLLGAFCLAPLSYGEEGMDRRPRPKVDLREICKKETQENCAGVQPGGGRIIECLKALPAEKLGADCKAGLDKIGEMREKRQERRAEQRAEKVARLEEACGEDMKKFCEGVEQGQGRIAKCLFGKKDQISAGCKDHLEKMRPRRGMKKFMGNSESAE